MSEAISAGRDALAILAYLFLYYGRAADAAALLRAMPAVDPDRADWASCALCVALADAGEPEAALAAGDGIREATFRGQPAGAAALHALARAASAVGRDAEARRWLLLARTLTNLPAVSAAEGREDNGP